MSYTCPTQSANNCDWIVRSANIILLNTDHVLKKIVFLSFFFISMNFEKNNLEIIGFSTEKQILKYLKAGQWEKWKFRFCEN